MRPSYLGSQILGVNDALVEVMAAIAALSVALQDTKLVALAAIITGLAGTLSMTAGEYLEKDTEEAVEDTARTASHAAFYTGITYFGVAFALIVPFFVFSNYITALTATLIVGFMIVVAFTKYTTLPEDRHFWQWSEFPQRFLLSFGIAFIAFLLGFVLRVVLGITA